MERLVSTRQVDYKTAVKMARIACADEAIRIEVMRLWKHAGFIEKSPMEEALDALEYFRTHPGDPLAVNMVVESVEKAFQYLEER
ncbi:hypothetical protein [Candidatus Magnetobacterium casense]|uniref:Uncharacterized protein n=1 Tax=Candidatus Magnetobacterium casense TaxID=1455061 RepID=A0ABS6S1Q2_9BACT|nr:hypothetical protein [Candidatus Magnetobacterium casensis]MBV6342348.1 hypothetical protein [Candidatus Magnetobacterium casensis]